jgi:hypothetical protein
MNLFRTSSSARAPFVSIGPPIGADENVSLALWHGGRLAAAVCAVNDEGRLDGAPDIG